MSHTEPARVVKEEEAWEMKPPGRVRRPLTLKLPAVREPMVAELEYRLVDEASVLKRLVVVALPKMAEAEKNFVDVPFWVLKLVDEALAAKRKEEVAKVVKSWELEAMVRESVVPVAFSMVTLPALSMEKSVVVATPVELAMLKSVALAEPTGVKMEREALGVLVPMPSWLLLVNVRVEDEVMEVPLKKLMPLVIWVFALVPPCEMPSTPLKRLMPMVEEATI